MSNARSREVMTGVNKLKQTKKLENGGVKSLLVIRRIKEENSTAGRRSKNSEEQLNELRR